RYFSVTALLTACCPTQLPLKELRSRFVSTHPGLPQQKIMDLIGKDDLLDLYVLLPQPLHQVTGLREWHVAVIVAMHEEHGRLPSRHGRHRRRIKRQLHRL